MPGTGFPALTKTSNSFPPPVFVQGVVTLVSNLEEAESGSVASVTLTNWPLYPLAHPTARVVKVALDVSGTAW